MAYYFYTAYLHNITNFKSLFSFKYVVIMQQ